MFLRVDPAWLAMVLLVSLRIAPLFIVAPVFGSVPAPTLFRAALIVSFSAAIVSATATAFAAPLVSLEQLLAYSMTELLVGAALAFGLAAAFGAFLFAGRLLDFQFGFGIANLIDPTSRSRAPLLGTVLNLLAITVFFAADGHLLLIRELALSLEHFPPGRSIAELNFPAVSAQFGLMFAMGLTIAAPAMFAILLLDIGFAAASRTMPQMNVFIVAIPFKIALGLLVLALSLRYLGAAMNRVFESIFQYWNAVLA